MLISKKTSRKNTDLSEGSSYSVLFNFSILRKKEDKNRHLGPTVNISFNTAKFIKVLE